MPTITKIKYPEIIKCDKNNEECLCLTCCHPCCNCPDIKDNSSKWNISDLVKNNYLQCNKQKCKYYKYLAISFLK